VRYGRLIYVLALLLPLQGTTQNILQLKEVLDLVRNHHPLMARADLVEDAARARLQQARGSFDPVLGANFSQKEYDDKQYYTNLESKLVVPTWFGIHGFAGYEFHRGDFLDPSRTVPEQGLPSAGIGISVLRGLIFDERRATLRQAQTARESAAFERIELQNQLYTRVVHDYWDWAYTWQEFQIFERSVALAREQLRIIRFMFTQGDVAAIDTLEALLLLQNREAGLNRATINKEQAILRLANHLWQNGRVPLEPSPTVVPDSLQNALDISNLPQDSLRNMLQNLPLDNPRLRMLDYRERIARLEVKLRRAVALPTLDVQYNILYSENGPLLSTNNYKAGAYLRVPLLFRRERGNLNLAKVQLNDLDWQIQQTRLELENSLKAVWTEFNTLTDQVRLMDDMVRNFRSLFIAEQQKFANGETTVFLLNARELSLIDAQVRLADVQRRLLKSEQTLYFIYGLPLF
jgi:outer membrane protein TolC